MPVSKLKAYAKQHNVSLDGCLEKSHIVEALERAGVQEDGGKKGSLDDAMGAEANDGETKSASPQDSGDRGEFESKVMLCEKDGSLKTDDLLKLKKSVGCDADDDAWCTEFEALVIDQGVLPQDGLSIAAVMALANTTKERLDQKQELEKTLEDPLFGGSPAAKKAKFTPVAPKAAPFGGLPGFQMPKFHDPRQAMPERVYVKKESVKCDACEKRPANAATVHCVNCKVFLCDTCNEENHPTKLLKGHIRVPADSVAEGASAPEVARVTSVIQPVQTNVKVGFAAKTGAELKKLAQYHGVKTAGCFEKEDFIAALRAANIPEEGVDADKNLPPKPVIPPPPDKKAAPGQPVPRKPDGTPVDPETAKRLAEEAKARQARWEEKKRQESVKLQESREMYNQVKPDFEIGSMWDLMSGIALWRNDFGYDRLFFINANKVNGWPNTIEVVQHGQQRMKVRGMQFDMKTKLMKGIPWQTGWLDIASIVDRASGQLMLKKAKMSAEQYAERDEKLAQQGALARMMGQRPQEMAQVAPAIPPKEPEPEPVSSETAAQRWGRFKKEETAAAAAPAQPAQPAQQPAPKPQEEEKEPQLFGGIGESEY